MQNMKTEIILGEAFLLFFALSQNAFLALLLALYMGYRHMDRNKLMEQIEALLEITEKDDSKDGVSQEALQKIKERYHGTPKRFEIYKGCPISDYHFYFEIQDPVGNTIEELFSTMDEAKSHIDKVEPYLPRVKERRSRVHNIRFVR